MKEPASAGVRTILVVDETASGRYVISRMLKAAGFSVTEAGSGADALRIARELPDLILLDIQMPDMSGFDVCRRLREDPVTAGIPVIHLTSVYLTPDDKVRGLESGADGFLFHPVEPVELVATIRALLRTKEAERRAESESRQWQVTFDGIRDAICIIDRDGRIVRANRAFLRLAGVDGDLAGRRCHELIHGSAPFMTGCPYRRALESGRRECGEVQLGDACYEIIVDPIADEGGEISRFVHLMRDVTVEKEQLERIRESEERYLLANRATFNVIYDWDVTSGILWWNEHFTSCFGYDHSEIAEGINGWTSLIHPDDRDSVLRSLETALEGGADGWSGEYRFRKRDGTYAIVIDRGVISRDGSGRAVRMIGAMEDVTGHRRLEEQLRQSQKMESIGLLAGGVAHDFNNILTVIAGYSDMALMTIPANHEYRRHFEQIRIAADRAAHLTRDLLLFSRNQGSERKPVDLNGCVGRMENFLRRILRENIRYETSLHASGLIIRADDHQMEQVIMNLAVNAQDAMPEGGRLCISTSLVPHDAEFVEEKGYGRPGFYARLTVSDTGCGMDGETVARIFDPFFTTKGVGKGTGLGLSVVYGIVRQHEGFITVESHPGQGSSFHVDIPLAGAAEAGDVHDDVSVALPHGNGTILLAEDDGTVRELTRHILESAGYVVVTAVDGQDAVESFREQGDRIDMVLLDLVMPRMNGREAFDEMTRIRPGLRGVFMSGYSPESVLTGDAFSRAGVRFLSKPVSHAELLQAVKTCIDETRRV